jgi:hypothetical protein
LPFEKHGVRGYLTSKALRTFDRAKTETFHFKIGSLLWQLAKPAYGTSRSKRHHCEPDGGQRHEILECGYRQRDIPFARCSRAKSSPALSAKTSAEV